MVRRTSANKRKSESPTPTPVNLSVSGNRHGNTLTVRHILWKFHPLYQMLVLEIMKIQRIC